jgi:hypothetical protein
VGCRRNVHGLKKAPTGLAVICVRGDASAQLFLASLHFRVVRFNVLAREADELFVVRSLKVMATWTIDRTHIYLPFL